MPTITDWLMVGITLVYVVATVFICIANFKAASASKAQLSEMQRQYEEENRPHIEVQLLYENQAFYGLRFLNYGKCTAQEVRIELDDAFIDSIDDISFRNLLLNQAGKKCIIGVGQHYDLFFASQGYRKKPDKIPATGMVRYIYHGKQYEDAFRVDLENYATFFHIENFEEKMLEKVDKLTRELREINSSIQQLNIASDKEDAHA